MAPLTIGPFRRAVVATRLFPFPLYGGAFLYTWQIVRAVAQVAGETVVIGRSRPDAGVPPATAQRIKFESANDPRTNIVLRHLSALPHAAAAVDSLQLRGLLALELSKQPDLIVLDHLGSSWAWSAIERHRRSNASAFVMYCTHNEEASTRLSVAASCGFSPARLAHLVDYFRIRRMDRRMIRSCDYVTCISSVDALLHEKLYGRAADAVISPLWSGPVMSHRRIDCTVPKRVVISGSFTWKAKQNDLVHFLDRCFQRLTEREILVRVVGRMCPELASSLRRKYAGLEVTGPVESMSEHLADSRIGLIIDESGGGFKLKSLEYVFHRLPIFGMRDAVVDLPLREGAAIRLFDSHDDLLVGVLENIDDVDRLDHQQNAAFSALQHTLTESRTDPSPVALSRGAS